MTTEGRVRLSRGSLLVQTSHRQPIIGTPALVPVPRKSSSTGPIQTGYNRGIQSKGRRIGAIRRLIGPERFKGSDDREVIDIVLDRRAWVDRPRRLTSAPHDH